MILSDTITNESQNFTVTIRPPSVSPHSFKKMYFQCTRAYISGAQTEHRDGRKRVDNVECYSRAQNGIRERRLDPRAHHGPQTARRTRERKMDPSAEDGLESAGWTRERRMDPRAQDGPESAGWTRERRMDPRAQDGPESARWTPEREMDPRAQDGPEENASRIPGEGMDFNSNVYIHACPE